MTSDIPKNSKNKSFLSSSLLKLIILVAFLALLISRCGLDESQQQTTQPLPTPTKSTTLDQETYGEKLDKYFAYFSFCRDIDEIYMFEQDLKLLERGLLTPADFSGYMLALGKYGLEVQSEAPRVIKEYGFHEDEKLANEFGAFGEQVLRLRLQVESLDVKQLDAILQNYKSLDQRTEPICNELKPL